MCHHFHVNVGTGWTFEVDEASLVTALSGSAGHTPADSALLLREALATPLDFPSIDSASVPGDRIVIAVDPLLPDPIAAVSGVLEALSRVGANADSITLAIPGSLAHLAEEWDASRLDGGSLDIEIAVHDPTDRASMAYLAATADGRPIYLNRLLCDADVLIPISCVPPPANPRWLGIYGSIYPAFSDSESADRYRISRAALTAAEHTQRQKEVDEVGWLLGVCVVVGVVPGASGSILGAVAGTPQPVTDKCVRMAREHWDLEVPRRVPLVITLVESLGGSLSWDDFAAALAAARTAAGEHGAVAVCGNFTRRPGRSLSRLVNASDLESVERRLHGDQHEDTWAAQELAQALQRGPVYFAGGLAEEQVEGLGMAPIQEPAELARLAKRFDECVVIRDAQIATPHVAGESRPAA